MRHLLSRLAETVQRFVGVQRLVMRRTWTPELVDEWLDDHLPTTGVIGLRWLLRRAGAAGIPRDALDAGLERARTWTWDGDGHHLTVIARRSSDDVRYRWRDPRWLAKHDPHALRYPDSDAWADVEREDVPEGTLEMVRGLKRLRAQQ
jgi:hypothetical protein